MKNYWLDRIKVKTEMSDMVSELNWAYQQGIITPNEARQLLGYQRIDAIWADTFVVPNDKEGQ